MIDDRVLLGFPIPFKNICKIYPPTVNDVSGDEYFNIYHALFTITQEDLNDEYLKDERVKKIPTPFEYLLLNYYQGGDMQQRILDGFKLFIHEPVTIIPEINMLLIGKSEDELDPDIDLENPRLLTEDNFFDFQNEIRTVLGIPKIQPPDPEETNLDPRILRYKRKVREGDKIRQKKKSKNGPKFGTLLAAICCMGIGLTPLNIGEISYACVHWLVEMEQQKEAYDIDIQALLAGADSKKVKPKYWIKNLDEKE